MALFDIERYSDCLRRIVSFKVFLPNDVSQDTSKHHSRETKILVLLCQSLIMIVLGLLLLLKLDRLYPRVVG